MSKAVGIIGGLGPAATLDLFGKLIAATPAERDQDHLRILIDNNPHVPDRNAALAGQGPSPGPVLADMARGLERGGAEVIVMACNTAHAWQSDIEAAIRVPFISMIETTVDATLALSRRPARVGLLAADGCLRAELYQRAFGEKNVVTLQLPDAAQRDFMGLLYRMKSGDVGTSVRAAMRDFAMRLADRGAEAIVAACTEVPLVLDAESLSAPFISSTDALVARVVKFARSD